ncbi:MAG: carboxypeptidase, partial [Actinobacteria bacterium]|nr:carboxypeptidase [Actinomycetota bacterium]
RGGDSWRVEVGVGNTGWLPTFVTQWARDKRLVLPIVAELSGASVSGDHARQEIGQLGGRLDMQFAYGKSDGSPDRKLVTWVVQAPAGTVVQVSVAHQRAGSTAVSLTLG